MGSCALDFDSKIGITFGRFATESNTNYKYCFTSFKLNYFLDRWLDNNLEGGLAVQFIKRLLVVLYAESISHLANDKSTI